MQREGRDAAGRRVQISAESITGIDPFPSWNIAFDLIGEMRGRTRHSAECQNQKPIGREGRGWA